MAMRRRQAVVVPVATELGIFGLALALVWAPAPQPTATPPSNPPASEDAAAVDAAILGESEEAPKRATVEQVRAKLTFYDQYGRGYQSKAGPPEGPGSERLQVVQPAASLTIRQRNQAISHTLTTVFDVVSAASPDALDAVSQASRYNEAGTLDVTTAIDTSDRDTLSFRYGVHVEEHWRTGFGGIGYSGSFNEENTVVSTSVNVIVDYFDDLHPRGWNDEQTYRFSLNDNLSLVQVLSPTTIAMLSYGITFQQGTLENGWNSIYIADAPTYGCFDSPDQRAEYDCENRRRENLPRKRIRHAVAAQLAQHLPRSRTTLKARYRHYRDDFKLRAHTLDTWVYQWMGRRVYLRAGYRFHRQQGNDFWRRSVLQSTPTDSFFTADSDLARFDAHEPSIKGVVYLRPPEAASGGASSFDLGFSRYIRTNDLHANVFSLGYAQTF